MKDKGIANEIIQENMCCHIRICKSMFVLVYGEMDVLCMCWNCMVFFFFFTPVADYFFAPASFRYLSILLCGCALHLQLCTACFNVQLGCFAFHVPSLLLHVVGCLKNEIYDNFMGFFLFRCFACNHSYHPHWDLFGCFGSHKEIYFTDVI